MTVIPFCDYRNTIKKTKLTRKPNPNQQKPHHPCNKPPYSTWCQKVCINAVTKYRNSTVSVSYLQASRYPPIMEVGWIFCFTSSSAFLRSSAAIITWLKHKHWIRASHTSKGTTLCNAELKPVPDMRWEPTQFWPPPRYLKSQASFQHSVSLLVLHFYFSQSLKIKKLNSASIINLWDRKKPIKKQK